MEHALRQRRQLIVVETPAQAHAGSDWRPTRKYVCMYACMYMNVCTYACIQGLMYVCAYV